MIKLIVGSKGSGKTKTVIDMINNAAKTSNGNVVVIEKSMALTYNIDHSARLIDLSEYDIKGTDAMYGFMAGILAGNYDITDLFLDGVLKCGLTLDELGSLLDKVNSVAGDSVHVVVTVSANEADLPESVKKYL